MRYFKGEIKKRFSTHSNLHYLMNTWTPKALDLLGLNAVLPWVLWESFEIAAISPVKSICFYHQSALSYHISIKSYRFKIIMSGYTKHTLPS